MHFTDAFISLFCYFSAFSRNSSTSFFRGFLERVASPSDDKAAVDLKQREGGERWAVEKRATIGTCQYTSVVVLWKQPEQIVTSCCFSIFMFLCHNWFLLHHWTNFIVSSVCFLFKNQGMLICVNKEQQVLQGGIPVLPSKLKKIKRGMNISFPEGLQCVFRPYREVLWKANNKNLIKINT